MTRQITYALSSALVKYVINYAVIKAEALIIYQQFIFNVPSFLSFYRSYPSYRFCRFCRSRF